MFWEVVGLLALLFAYYVWTALAPPDRRKESGGDWQQYIGQADAGRVAELAAKEASERVGDEEYIKVYNTPGRQVLMLYGSEYGFAEHCAKKLFIRLVAACNAANAGAGAGGADVKDEKSEESSGPKPLPGVTGALQLQPRLVNMRDYREYVDVSKEQVVLVVCSTTGDGVPPSEARHFFEDFTESKADLSGVSYSVLALGDSGYPHFCRAGKTLDTRFKELRATPLVARVDVDLEDWSAIDGWLERCVGSFAALAQTNRWTVRDDYLSKLEPPKPPKRDGFDRNRPFKAVVTAKQNLTAPAGTDAKNDKETIHIEFDLADSKLQYTPGDALGMMPLNNPPEVSALLKVLGLGEGNRRMANPKKQKGGAADPDYDPMPTTRSLLYTYYDLKKVRPELLQALLPYVTNAEQKRKLSALLQNGLSKANGALHDFLKDREAVDVFEAFSSAVGGATGANGGSLTGATGGIPLDKVLDNLRALQPRYYSIASCPETNPGKVQLCVAIVRYNTHGKNRTGTATTFMQDRTAVGDKVPVFVSVNHEFRLPTDPNKPIVMIGPGTGLAPFRAFIQNRLLHKAAGKMVLYFGCRSSKIDYLYGQQLDAWAASGAIELRNAFSREPNTPKVYVQHLIAADGQKLWALLEAGAHVYVCGDGANMATDVHNALRDILKKYGGAASDDAAEARLELLVKQKRYQRDVWVT